MPRNRRKPSAGPRRARRTRQGGAGRKRAGGLWYHRCDPERSAQVGALGDPEETEDRSQHGSGRTEEGRKAARRTRHARTVSPGRRSAQSRRSGAAGTRCRHAGECQRSTYRQPSGRRGAEEGQDRSRHAQGADPQAGKLEAPDDDQQAELARLRQQLHEAEQALAAAQSAAPAPAAKSADDEALKRPRSKPPCSRRSSASWKSSKHRTRTSRPSSLVCVSSCTKPNRPWRRAERRARSRRQASG